MALRYQPTQEDKFLGYFTGQSRALKVLENISDKTVMNIKGFIPNIFGFKEVRSVEKAGQAIKSDETHDRDANGQEAFGEKQDHHEPMSDEQIKTAMDQLRNLSVAKEHKWTVHLEIKEAARFVVIKDNLGNVIRKIPELELWSLPQDSSAKGQILKRSA